MRDSRFRCLCAAALFSLNTTTPQQYMDMAKQDVAVSEKITILRRMLESYPDNSLSIAARDQLVALLSGSNRYEEALREFRKENPELGAGDSLNFPLLDHMLKTGRYQDVLRATAVASGPKRDIGRDLRILELRVQAFLARGLFTVARGEVDRWLARYEAEGEEGTRFETDVKSMKYLRRHLKNLERLDGSEGKALFTASVPDSIRHWSRRRNVPIYFYKLIPTHPAGQMASPVLPGRYETDEFFHSRVDDLNRGLSYLSGDSFSLAFKDVDTLYVREGDVDPVSSGGHILTSRVYTHTLPQLYRLAGEAFVVLVDYRTDSNGEAAYMGDGLIHISASKLQTLVLMHEVLHGLGATHNEWASLRSQGFQFDPDDRGVMTFDRGEIRDLGLEEKNRALLGWPRVAVIRLGDPSDTAGMPEVRPRVAFSHYPTGLN